MTNSIPQLLSVVGLVLAATGLLVAEASGQRAARTGRSGVEGGTVAADSLPTGRVVVGQTTFDLSADARVKLSSGGAEPVELARWEPGRKASHLCVVHTFEPGAGIADWRAATGLAHRQAELPPDWPTVFNYELEYVDGQKVVIPVRFGESIREWRRVHTVGPMLWAREAWTRDIDADSGEKHALYAMEAPNPRPDVAIAAVRAVPSAESHRDYGTAWILGLTTKNAPAAGKLYFVDRKPIGHDGQPGTLDAPFGTLQHALAVAGPGDTIYVRKGLYVLDDPVLKEFEGEQGKWLTISAFPGETPIFDARGIHPDYRERPYGERPNRVGRNQLDTGAIHLWGNPHSTRIQGLHVYNSRRAAISVYGQRQPDSAWGQTHHVDISFNTTCRSYSMGIISHQTNDLTIIGNRIMRPHALEMAFDPFTDEPISQGELPQEGIDISRNRRFEIAFNIVGGGGKEAIDCISIEDGQIHHNYVYDSLNGIYIDSWSVPIRRLKIHHNFIHNAYNGIPLATEGSNDLVDFEIHHNIVINSKGGAIAVTEATYKAKPARVQRHNVYNNTIDQTGGHCIAIGWQVSGIGVGGFPDNQDFREVTVFDNIITNTIGRPMTNRYSAVTAEHAIKFTHNLVWPTLEDTTPSWMRQERKSWRAGDLHLGDAVIHADPEYADPARGDYRLTAGSPAIGAGVDGGDLGALPYGAAWAPGLDFAGHTTAYYHGPTFWKPLSIHRDLFTMHRNHLQRPSWFQRGRYGPDFRDLPDGQRSYAGVTWFLERDDHNADPTLLVLSGHSSEAKADSIEGIAVGRKATKLAFLHNVHVAGRGELGEGGVIFHYRVNYADGRSVDVPIRLGIEIEDWMQDQARPIRDGRIAWMEKVTHKRGNISHLHLYSYEWSNPRADVVIESIGIIRDAPPLVATPAVFAISTGHAEPID